MKNELRVLQYVKVLDNGGTESLLFNLLDKTDRNILNYDFLLTRNQVESHEGDVEKYGSRKIVIEMDHSGNWLKGCKDYYNLFNYFKTCPYRIVHFQSAGYSWKSSLALLVAKKAGIPVRIVHAHGGPDIIKDTKKITRRIDNLIGQILKKRWGTHFMACSTTAAEQSFGKNYNRYCKVEILKNGIDVEKFAFSQEERASVRGEFELNGRFVLGSIARLTRQKNHVFMLDVLREVLKLRKDAILLLVGSATYGSDDYLKKLIQAINDRSLQDYVKLVEERKDAYRIYSAMDVYLFPSRWEGLGIAAVEAQSNGLPVYASDVVPIETKITSNFHYLSLNDSPEKWAESICNSDNKRIDEREKIYKAGYNALDSATFLTNYYLSLIE